MINSIKITPFPQPQIYRECHIPYLSTGQMRQEDKELKVILGYKTSPVSEVLEVGSAVECLPSMQEVLELIHLRHRMNQASECTPVISALGR